MDAEAAVTTGDAPQVSVVGSKRVALADRAADRRAFANSVSLSSLGRLTLLLPDSATTRRPLAKRQPPPRDHAHA